MTKLLRMLLSVGILTCLIVLSGITGITDEQKPTLKINTYSWTSAEVHAHIAGFIIEHAYGFPVKYQGGASVPVVLGMSRGDLDFGMESWTNNIAEPMNKGYLAGDLISLGQCYPNAPHGYYVPAYVIKGDEERGIEPMAPDLKTLSDLTKYWEVFRDPEDPDKGRIYGVPSVWNLARKDPQLFEETGVSAYFNNFDSGTQAGLIAAATAAYEKGKPVVFYYWEPTWLMGKYDFIRLKFPPVVKEKGLYPLSNKVHIVANPSLAQKAPRVVSFLANYQTTLEQNNTLLAWMQDTDGTVEEAAIWFLKNYKDVWHQWFPCVYEPEEELIQAVEDALAKV